MKFEDPFSKMNTKFTLKASMSDILKDKEANARAFMQQMNAEFGKAMAKNIEKSIMQAYRQGMPQVVIPVIQEMPTVTELSSTSLEMETMTIRLPEVKIDWSGENLPDMPEEERMRVTHEMERLFKQEVMRQQMEEHWAAEEKKRGELGYTDLVDLDSGEML